MLKKVAFVFLAMTVLGAGGVVTYTAAANSVPSAAGTASAVEPAPNLVSEGQASTAKVAAPVQPEPQPQADVGEPWSAQGTISALDETGTGFTMDTSDGATLYVELGPPTYWQSLGVPLAVGDVVVVDGFQRDGQYHAGTISKPDGQQLVLRTELGQPLWSGGVQNAGDGNGLQDGSHEPQPQAQVDEWLTVSGTLVELFGNTYTIQTDAGNLMTLSAGAPRRFLDEQPFIATPGDALTFTYFENNGSFSAADIANETTGARLMLRDPNGRPLWAGPGRGNSNGNGFANTAAS
jgi:hypothetical protein